jgi:hypothetical protein
MKLGAFKGGKGRKKFLGKLEKKCSKKRPEVVKMGTKTLIL